MKWLFVDRLERLGKDNYRFIFPSKKTTCVKINSWRFSFVMGFMVWTPKIGENNEYSSEILYVLSIPNKFLSATEVPSLGCCSSRSLECWFCHKEALFPLFSKYLEEEYSCMWLQFRLFCTTRSTMYDNYNRQCRRMNNRWLHWHNTHRHDQQIVENICYNFDSCVGHCFTTKNFVEHLCWSVSLLQGVKKPDKAAEKRHCCMWMQRF